MAQMVAVVPAVDRDLVPLGDDAVENLRMPLDHCPEYEKRCVDIGGSEDVEHLRCATVIGAVVEGQRDMIGMPPSCQSRPQPA